MSSGGSAFAFRIIRRSNLIADAAAVVGASYPSAAARAIGHVLARDARRPWANGAAGLRSAPAGGVVLHKAHPTFSDALAVVGKEVWAEGIFRGPAGEADTAKVPRE